MDAPLSHAKLQVQNARYPELTSGPVVDTLLFSLALVGLLVVGSRVLSFARLLLSLFVVPGRSLRSFGPKGSWALITGASDGLGKQFALQLASSGFNIILVSRTATKLDEVVKTIQSSYNVQTKSLAMDFAANNDSDYARLNSLITNLDIAVLINNVGKSHEIPVTFAETAMEEMRDIITINCTATLRTTSLVLPGMISRKRGLVLTMGSFGGLLPTPLLATYSGSKAFLQQWSSSLGAEVAPFGITVELVQSYLVTSAMSKIRRSTMTIPTPKTFVKAVLAKIGRSGGAQGWAYTSTPFWSHAVMQWTLGTFLGMSNKFVVGQNKGMHQAIRTRALRKRERESGKKAS